MGKRFDAVMPIFLVLLPSYIGLGGNVGSVLGSRLSSGLHLGLIRPTVWRNRPLLSNISALTISGLISFASLGLFVYLLAHLTGIVDLGPMRFMSITLLSGTCLISITVGVSVWACFASFKRGMDPDDLVVPIVTTLADTVGIVLLVFFITMLGA